MLLPVDQHVLRQVRKVSAERALGEAVSRSVDLAGGHLLTYHGPTLKSLEMLLGCVDVILLSIEIALIHGDILLVHHHVVHHGGLFVLLV